MRVVARLALVLWVAAPILLPTSALGFGAVAEAQGEDNSESWRTLGWELNVKTQSEAETSAVQSCENVRVGNGWRGPSCRVVESFSQKCLVIAHSDKQNSLGVSWGVDADSEAAERKALTLCRERAGRESAGFCKVARKDCDKAPTSAMTTVAAVVVTGAAAVLIWNLIGGAAIPALNIISGVLGIAAALYLLDSFAIGGDAGGAAAQSEIEVAISSARRATYVSIGVATASALAIFLTLLWATKRVRAMQATMDRMKSGASRILDPRSLITGFGAPTSRKGSSVMGTTQRTTYGSATGRAANTRLGATGVSEAGAEMLDGAMILQPIDGSAAIRLDPRRLQGAGVVIGRDQSCEVVVRDENVSSRHARLFMDHNGALRIEDLGSTNGTWRNGVQVKSASLRSGSVLKLGRKEYTVKITLR